MRARALALGLFLASASPSIAASDGDVELECPYPNGDAKDPDATLTKRAIELMRAATEGSEQAHAKLRDGVWDKARIEAWSSDDLVVSDGTGPDSLVKLVKAIKPISYELTDRPGILVAVGNPCAQRTVSIVLKDGNDNQLWVARFRFRNGWLVGGEALRYFVIEETL